MPNARSVLTNPSVIAIVATLLVGAYAANQGFVEVSLQKLETGTLGTLFLTLIFAALVIERAVEVYINNRYNPEEMTIQREIREARQKLALLEEAIANEQAREAPRGGEPAVREAAITEKKGALEKLRDEAAAAREEVRRAKVAALDEQIDLETRKASAAGAVATVLGLAAAAAGLRVLGQFLPVDAAGEVTGVLAKAENAFQLKCFRFADIVLTAFLLAGGADGIHNLLKDFLSKKSEFRPTA